jgi:hypothetical protein
LRTTSSAMAASRSATTPLSEARSRPDGSPRIRSPRGGCCATTPSASSTGRSRRSTGVAQA